MFKFKKTPTTKTIVSFENKKVDYFTAKTFFKNAKKSAAKASFYKINDQFYPRYRNIQNGQYYPKYKNLSFENITEDAFLVSNKEVNKFIALCIEELAVSLMKFIKLNLACLSGELRIMYDPDGIEYIDDKGCIRYTRLYGIKFKNSEWRTVFILDDVEDKCVFQTACMKSVTPTLTFFEDSDKGNKKVSLDIFLYEPWEVTINKKLESVVMEITL